MRSLLAELFSNRMMALLSPASRGCRAPLGSIGRAPASPRQRLWFSSVLGQQHRCIDCVAYRSLVVAPFLQHRREMLSVAVQVRDHSAQGIASRRLSYRSSISPLYLICRTGVLTYARHPAGCPLMVAQVGYNPPTPMCRLPEFGRGPCRNRARI
jgi:hypothetical protein